MLNEIERERKMAEHLFYVSLKYTKTGDVILNLIKRWGVMLDRCMDLLLRRAKKNKKIKEIPFAPKLKNWLLDQFIKTNLSNKLWICILSLEKFQC